MARITKKKKPVAKAKKASLVKKPAKKTAKPAAKTTKKAAPKAVKKATLKKTAKVAKPAPKAIPAKPASVKPKTLEVGSPAPDFTMPATKIGTVSLASLKGKPVVLYFYPKDDTSGCTAQACEFRNTLPSFTNLDATIIGVSKDDMESHEKFSRKYNLPFPLASDATTGICEKYGTWVQKSMYGRTYMGIERSTFLIDGKGIIRAVWRKVSVPGHIDEVRKAVEAL